MQATVWTRLPSGALRLSKRIPIVQPSCAGATIMAKRSMSSTHDADLVVIGSGPGGYVAAIKAAQLGMKVIS